MIFQREQVLKLKNAGSSSVILKLLLVIHGGIGAYPSVVSVIVDREIGDGFDELKATFVADVEMEVASDKSPSLFSAAGDVF